MTGRIDSTDFVDSANPVNSLGSAASVGSVDFAGMGMPDSEIRVALALRAARRRTARRIILATTLLVLLLIALLLADLMLGHEVYSLTDVLSVVSGLVSGLVSGRPVVGGLAFAIGELRLPRVLVGALCGLAFGMAGASFQHLLRNVMASPDIIGITAGANTAAVFGIIVLGLSGPSLSALAVAGGLVTALLVIRLAWSGSFAPNRLILTGIGVAAAFNALSSWILIRGDQWDVQTASRWLTGSLASAEWSQIPAIVAVVLVAGCALLAFGRQVDALRFGVDVARGLGVRADLTQTAVIVLSVLLLSAATATSGPIAFVSFLAGPIALRIIGPHKPAIAQAGLVGACLVLAADIVAQHVPPTQLPVGVVTSIIGGPVLVALMVRITRRQEF
ncbi:iron ABC transporter permease [uncultured Bifidobacterium sp.]|uniref:FecCD family ABC transporter permease n=1 Tax=uncultured Bifidobacterium sp. TaxID=165187 RepID=UPI0028DBA675|nr:iron ABC transporter permease [uncultured Bifidobacterium sp.]